MNKKRTKYLDDRVNHWKYKISHKGNNSRINVFNNKINKKNPNNGKILHPAASIKIKKGMTKVEIGYELKTIKVLFEDEEFNLYSKKTMKKILNLIYSAIKELKNR